MYRGCPSELFGSLRRFRLSEVEQFLARHLLQEGPLKMARVPPRRQGAASSRGPRQTERLPDRHDARRTWRGPPYQRSKGRWSGAVDFGGVEHHVGTFDSPRAWGEARDRVIAELRDARRHAYTRGQATELEGVTIAQFVGPDCEGWPWRFKKNGRRKKRSTFEHHEQCIRPFVARFGTRLLKGGVSRSEARDWANHATEKQLTSAIALYNDAYSDDESIVNPLDGLSRQRTKGRADLPDVLTAEEVVRLRELARQLNPGGYGLVMEAMVEMMATTAPRPGELWAMEWSRANPTAGELFIKYAVKKNGRLDSPKFDQERIVVVAPSAFGLILNMPRLSERFLFPSKTGRVMSQSNWTTYWHPLRAAFTSELGEDHWLVRRIAEQTALRDAEPNPTRRARISNGQLDLYELRHRAITYMATPRPHGLGLASPDVAHQVGHRDGGLLVERVYIHRNPELTRARLRAAMGYHESSR
jgi:integrase